MTVRDCATTGRGCVSRWRRKKMGVAPAIRLTGHAPIGGNSHVCYFLASASVRQGKTISPLACLPRTRSEDQGPRVKSHVNYREGVDQVKCPSIGLACR